MCVRVGANVYMRAHSCTVAAHTFRGVKAGSTDGAEPRGPLRECRCLLERMEVSGKLCKGNGWSRPGKAHEHSGPRPKSFLT